MKLREIGEFGLIDRIAPLGRIRSSGVIKGIGDDCAVMDVGGPDYLLVTTDLLVERVHFMLEWGSAEALGAKALVVNISDIAACGGRPLDAFISIGVPDHVTVEWLDGFYRGMSSLANDYDVNIMGGDTTGSQSDLIINVAVTGTVPRDQVLWRHTARPGDKIVLTGRTGESGAGCHLLLSRAPVPEEIARPLIKAHLEPRPHVAQARILAESGACITAIDVSDGISSDIGHLCTQSGVGAIVYETELPMGSALLDAARLTGCDPLHWALNGGEDYVLLAAVSQDGIDAVRTRLETAGHLCFVIGEFVEGGAMILKRRNGETTALRAGGWDHFAERGA